MFRIFDFRRFGVWDLTLESMQRLKANLKADNKLFLKYLVMKRGFDPEDPVEYNKAIELYQKKIYSPVLTPDLKSDRYMCQISASITPGELMSCIDAIKSTNEVPKNFLKD